MLMHVLTDNESLEKDSRFKKFMKSACIQVASGAQIKEELKHTQTAEKTHQTQVKCKNTHVQKEGILCAGNYFAIQQQKKIDALTAAENAAMKTQEKLEQEHKKIQKKQEVEAQKLLQLQKKLEQETKTKARQQAD